MICPKYSVNRHPSPCRYLSLLECPCIMFTSNICAMLTTTPVWISCQATWAAILQYWREAPQGLLAVTRRPGAQHNRQVGNWWREGLKPSKVHHACRPFSSQTCGPPPKVHKYTRVQSLALYSAPEISPSPFAPILLWNATMIDLLFPVNLSLFLPSLSNLPFFPLLLPRAVDPSWMQLLRFYMWKQDVEIFKRELSCLKTSFPLERKDYSVLFAWKDRRLITQGLLWQRRART